MKKTINSIAFIMLVICTIFLCACQKNEPAEEIPLGRFVERDVTLPGSGYEYMHPLADGGYYLYGNDVDFTKIDALGNVQKENWAWESNYNVRSKTAYAIDDNGAAVFAFLPLFYTDEELETLGTDEEIRYRYYYVDKQGERKLLSLHGDNYSPTDFFESFSFAPDGTLYGATYRHVCRIDLETEEVKLLFETDGLAGELVFMDNTLIATDKSRFYLYDINAEKPLEENAVLNDFLATHQSSAVVLAADETSQSGERILYIACRTGLYRYVWDGSVIEQIADGRMLSLGNSQYQPIAMQALNNGEFRMLFTGNHMVELYYDETIPARPSRELVVYSLNENARLRYAGQLFQKQNPDVLVVYETGMEGDSAVSKEDALRNLNTRLLAGEGPDVLLLDDIDIEQYAEKGVLRELDDLLRSYEEEDSLYQNIIEGMRLAGSEKIYAIPLNVRIPLYLSETKYLDSQTTLPDLITGAKYAREEHPDGPILYTPFPTDIYNELLPVCISAWTAEDGSLQTEQIAEFYRTADELWKLDHERMDENRQKFWQEENNYDNDLDRLDLSISRWISFGDYDEVWMYFCFTQKPCQDMRQIHLAYSGFQVGGGYQSFKQLDDIYAMGFGKLGGQAQDVYWAQNITAICEQAKEPELAEDFLRLLLSDEMMRKWWIGNGYPIRKESLSQMLDINNREWAQVEGMNTTSSNLWYADYTWPTEEEKAWIDQILEEAKCPYFPGSILEETVKETGLRVLDGTLTPEEGAAEVKRRMSIEMEE